MKHAEIVPRDATYTEYFEVREQIDELVSDEPERAWIPSQVRIGYGAILRRMLQLYGWHAVAGVES